MNKKQLSAGSHMNHINTIILVTL